MVTGETRAGEMEEAYQTESATRRATGAPYRPLRYHSLPPEVGTCTQGQVRNGCFLLLLLAVPAMAGPPMLPPH